MRKLIALACFVSLLAGFLQTTPAAADTDETIHVEATMTLDCVNLSPEAATYAQRHGYCPPKSNDGSTSSPVETVSGNCGTSWLYITQAASHMARITYGFRSTKGHVVHRFLIIHWDTTGDLEDTFPDTAFMASPRYQGDRTVRTGRSVVHAWGSNWPPNG